MDLSPIDMQQKYNLYTNQLIELHKRLKAMNALGEMNALLGHHDKIHANSHVIKGLDESVKELKEIQLSLDQTITLYENKMCQSIETAFKQKMFPSDWEWLHNEQRYDVFSIKYEGFKWGGVKGRDLPKAQLDVTASDDEQCSILDQREVNSVYYTQSIIWSYTKVERPRSLVYYDPNKYIAKAKLIKRSYSDTPTCRDYNDVIEIYPNIKKMIEGGKPLCSFRDYDRILYQFKDSVKVSTQVWAAPFKPLTREQFIARQQRLKSSSAHYYDDNMNMELYEFDSDIGIGNVPLECDQSMYSASIILLCIVFLIVCIGSNCIVGVIVHLFGRRCNKSSDVGTQ